MRNRAVFLDRDGTIAKDVHYCRRPEDFELLVTVPEAIRLLNASNFKVVVITNQSGIARGYFTEKTLDQIHRKMRDELAEHGAHIDAIYYCPHHPDDSCDCRKPSTALFRKAAKDLDIDVSRSSVVGDMRMDIAAGEALGCKTILVTTGPQPPSPQPPHCATSLLEAAQWIVEDAKSVPRPSTSIIVPAYNEAQGLFIVLEKMFKVINGSYEVIVVDDGSTDETSEVTSHFPCRLIKHKVNEGKGEALETGMKNAQGENVIWVDADDTYPVEIIVQMAEALKNYDIVVGSRVYGKANIPRFNRFGNWIFRTMIKTIYGFKPHDPMTGLYGAKRVHLEMMKLSSKRFAIEPEISIKASRMKLKMLDVPVQYRPRVGSSKLSAIKVGVEDLTKILQLVFWQPDRGKGDE